MTIELSRPGVCLEADSFGKAASFSAVAARSEDGTMIGLEVVTSQGGPDGGMDLLRGAAPK